MKKKYGFRVDPHEEHDLDLEMKKDKPTPAFRVDPHEERDLPVSKEGNQASKMTFRVDPHSEPEARELSVSDSNEEKQDHVINDPHDPDHPRNQE